MHATIALRRLREDQAREWVLALALAGSSGGGDGRGSLFRLF